MRPGRTLALFAACATLFATPSSAAEGDQWHHEPPPAEIAALELPEGRLAGVGGNPGRVAFIATDQTKRHGDLADAIVFWVYDQGVSRGDDLATQLVFRDEFDCKAHTFRNLGSKLFNDRDVMVGWEPADTTSTSTGPNPTYHHLAMIACGLQAFPTGMLRHGHKEAVTSGRVFVRGLAEIGVGSFEVQDRHRHGEAKKAPPK
jgi:hypothetical protein